MSTKRCKHCGEDKPLARMRSAQCYDCLNDIRRGKYAADPAERKRRGFQRDSAGADPSAHAQRQARYRARARHQLTIRVHLPHDRTLPSTQEQPVILPDWFWYLVGRRVVGRDFDAARVNPASYDTLLADRLLLQRYRGREYPNTPAELLLNPRTNEVLMGWRDPQTGAHKSVSLPDHPFLPGDSVLAKTKEVFKVPRFVRLQGMLKSSPAREGLDSRSALYVDPHFEGSVTLELHFDRSGYLIPGQPLVQFEAQVCLSYRPYAGHYALQHAVTPNRNLTGIAFRSTVS